MSGKKRISFAVALIFLLVSMLGTFVFATDGLELRRLGGKDRYFTAIEISKEWESSEYVILATGQNYADALAAAPLAAALDAPILLTRNSWVDTNMYVFDAILEAIEDLNPRKIFILSSASLVSAQVEEALSENYEVERIYGNNRYETSAKIAEKIYEIKQSINKEAFITDGYDFQGALSVSGYAAQAGSPIFFASSRTDKPELNKLNDKVKDAIINLGIEKVTVVGNIASGVIAELEAMSIEVDIIPIDSLKIAKENYENPQGVIIARSDPTPDAWADALVGGALAAKLGYPMILLPGGIKELPEEVEAYIKENKSIVDARYLGGSAVISDEVCSQVEALILANYQENQYAEALKNMIMAYVQDAEFGSRITANISSLGKIYYPAAVQYQLFEGDVPVSAAAGFGTPVTVVPRKAAGDLITVKLYDQNGAELVAKEIALKADQSDVIKGYAASAVFGSTITVSIDVKGVADYPEAISYQIFDQAGEVISAVANLDAPTTVFPKQEAGDTVIVKLYDKNGAKLAEKSIVLEGDSKDTAKGYIDDAEFGSRVALEIIVAGASDYYAATGYQLFDGDKAISAVAGLNSPVIIPPGKSAGDTLTVKLIDKNGSVIGTEDIVLEANPEDKVVAYLNDAEFGSRITLNINVKGPADYPAAVSYQLFSGDTPVSHAEAIGKSVTVVPKASLGDTFKAVLLDANGAKVGEVEVTLIKPGADLFEGIEIGDGSEEPGEEPSDPGEEPTDPGEDPTDPGEEPTPPETPVDEADEYSLTCSSATFGALLKLTINVKGEADYPDVAKWRVFQDDEPITNLSGTPLGENTTVFPAPADGTAVKVELLNSNGDVIGAINLIIEVI